MAVVHTVGSSRAVAHTTGGSRASIHKAGAAEQSATQQAAAEQSSARHSEVVSGQVRVHSKRDRRERGSDIKRRYLDIGMVRGTGGRMVLGVGVGRYGVCGEGLR
jgi:hypothetical protein